MRLEGNDLHPIVEEAFTEIFSGVRSAGVVMIAASIESYLERYTGMLWPGSP